MIIRPPVRSHSSIQKRPVFLLYGIDGTFNYGCEGIIRGTLEILRETLWRNVDVVFLSRRFSDDRRSLSNSQLKIRGLHSKLWPSYLVGALARRAGLHWKASSRLPVDLIRSAAAAICIGGDVYDPDSEYLQEFTDLAQRFGVPVVYWGASFPAYERTTSYSHEYLKHLNSLSLITVREPASMEFLNAQGIKDNVQLCADPAFCMKPEAFPLPFERYSSEAVIGINLSPYSTALTFGYDRLDQKATDFAHVIERLLDAIPCQILLTPHVLSPVSHSNNDAIFMRTIADRVKKKQERLHLGPTGIGAQRTKGLLSNCDLVIAARMHCCIAALSAGVPTILLSYSQKARGMSRYVYGNDEWALSLRHVDADGFVRSVLRAVDKQEEVSSQLGRFSALFRNDALRGGLALKEMLLATPERRRDTASRNRTVA